MYWVKMKQPPKSPDAQSDDETLKVRYLTLPNETKVAWIANLSSAEAIKIFSRMSEEEWEMFEAFFKF